MIGPTWVWLILGGLGIMLLWQGAFLILGGLFELVRQLFEKDPTKGD